MKFVVAQAGARRGYAVPAILEKAGMLERFYTDVCADVGLGRMLLLMRRVPGVGDRMSGLATRRVPMQIRSKTLTFGGSMFGRASRLFFEGHDPTSRFRAQSQWGRDLGNAMARMGFGSATHVFSMLGECAPFLAAAKLRGLKVVTEVYILLSTVRILENERESYPEWESKDIPYAEIVRSVEDWLPRTDFFICPSEAVQNDLIVRWGVQRDQTALVPYGMAREWLDLEAKPQRGRVLFVGTADLRKGIHYLAMAAEKLMAKGRRFEFRIAGNVSPTVFRQPACRHFNFLGRVPRDRIAEEFTAADVFVLPSLAEGSAEVTYEALAAGVPVVTTKAAGSVARDGIEGRIIPERDPDALATAVEELVEDRAKRDRMAAAARERAKDFTWERYGQRLITALKSFPQ